MKGREKMIAVLEIIRFAAAIALVVALIMLAGAWWYENLRETAYTEAGEQLKKAIENATRPVVKVEIQTKGKW